MKHYEFWFVVGSQTLYGEEVLRTVAARAEEMAQKLSAVLPYPLKYKVTAKSNAEILDAFDDLLGWYRSSGLFAQYYNELSRLTVDHVLLAGSVRVLRIDPDSELLGRFQDYVQTQFPDWRDNPYLQQLPRKRRLLVSLLLKKRYGTVRALFLLKQKIS